MFWVHTGLLQRQDMWYQNSNDQWNYPLWLCVPVFLHFFSFIFQESPVEMRVGGGLLQGQGHWLQQCMHGTCWRRCHYLHYLHHVWPQVKQQGGNTASPNKENWMKDLLSMVTPIRTRPSVPLSQSLPSGSFHKPLILLHQRADRLKTTITEDKPNWSHGPQPCLTQWNYEWAMPWRATQGRWVMLECSDKTWSTGEGNGKPLPYFCLENLINSMKRQKYRTLKD